MTLFHCCEQLKLEGDVKITSDFDEDQELDGWWIKLDGYPFGRLIYYCPYCGQDLTRSEWKDLK